MKPPERGDLVWIDFDPQSGREQARAGPDSCAVQSPERAGDGLPSHQPREGYPFEVALPVGGRVEGVILCDHATSIDWRTRRADFIAVAPAQVLEEVTARVQALIGGENC